MNVVATIVGLVVVVMTVSDVVLTMILPRRPSGIERLSLQVNRCVRLCFVVASHLAKTYERQDAILAPTGPAEMAVPRRSLSAQTAGVGGPPAPPT